MRTGPDPRDVNRAVRTLRLVLQLISSDPLAQGARAMLEAWTGKDIGEELEAWLKDPAVKAGLRDRFVEEMVRIWREGK